jgi:hypothetical protein
MRIVWIKAILLHAGDIKRVLVEECLEQENNSNATTPTSRSDFTTTARTPK